MPPEPYERFLLAQGERWDHYACPVCGRVIQTTAGLPGAFASHLRIHRAKGQIGTIIPRDVKGSSSTP